MSLNNKVYIECLDYNVSRETFKLILEENTGLLKTTPQPKLQDLAKYYEDENYISHTDATKTAIDKIYQIVKNYAIKKKVKLIKKQVNTNKLSVLDIGCGTGDFLKACEKQNWYITGIEPNKKATVLLQTKINKLSLFKDISEIKKQNQFDVITMWHVLEHVPNLENYIKQIKKLIKPNGLLIVAVPNYKSFDAAYYKKYWAAYDVPRHLWHFSQKAIHSYFNKENMVVIKTVAMKLDSFYVSMLSEKNKHGKNKLITAFFIGLKSNYKAMKTKEYSSLIYIIKNN